MTATAASLYDRFFQFGYVARDLDAAMAQFNARFGPVQWQTMPGSPDYPETKRLAVSYRDGMMVEIIEVNPEVRSIYAEYLPKGSADIRLHHLGYLVDDYKATHARLEREGYSIPMAVSWKGILHCCYVDTRALLGHYLEYVQLDEKGKKWFTAMPGFPGFPPARS